MDNSQINRNCDMVVDINESNRKVIKYLREQRHDFMNHLQVIWGYLQLNKPSQALKYIGDINKEYTVLGSLFKIDSPVLSLFLYDNVKKAFKQNINVDLEAELDDMEDIFNGRYGDALNGISVLFEDVARKAAESEDKTMYIDIFQEDGMLHIVFSDNSFDDLCDYSEGSWLNPENDVREALENLQQRGLYTFYMREDNRIIVRTGFPMNRL